jgi:hypothetical protein
MTADEARIALTHAEGMAISQMDIGWWLRADPRHKRIPDFAGLDRAVATVASIIAEHGPDFAVGESTSAASVAASLAGTVAYTAEFRPKSRRASS